MATDMDDQLYERCPSCDGTGLSQGSPGVVACGYCCRGFIRTGLTVGQVERMVEREHALAGDPVVPDRRRRVVLDRLAERLAKVRVPAPAPTEPRWEVKDGD